MARTLTNNANWAYAKEASLNTLPGSPEWRNLQPNSISEFGAQVTTTHRDFISKNRQRQKGRVTDLNSAVGFDVDMTMDSFEDFIEGFVFATRTRAFFQPTAVTGTGYTVASGGALVANTLVYARGFDTAANNGLKVVGASSTSTEVKVSGLTAEASPPSNVRLDIAGYRAASGDLGINSDGNLISTTLDFTTLGLTAGQFIHIGGEAAGTQFATSDNNGLARIVSIAANLIVLDKKATTFVTDAGTSKTIDIYAGTFIRNVDVDDADFLTQSYQFEASYTDLDSAGTDEYEYAKGNYANELSVTMETADKAGMSFGFVGTDTEPPSTTRASGASSALDPVNQDFFNTSADFVRLRMTDVDETGLSTDFNTLSIGIRNNVTPEKVLGTLGGKYMNYGNFEVQIDAELLFTDSTVSTRIRNGTTITMDFALKNGDGGIVCDIPSLTLGGGEKGFPANETITLSTTAMAEEDETLGTSLGISTFPFYPTL